MNKLERIVFYSKLDLAGASMLEKAEKRLNISSDFATMDLNALLEFHHIHKYFENELYLNQWSKEQKEVYVARVKLALDELRTFFLNINVTELMTEVSKLEFDNRGNFWEFFQYYKLYYRIDRDIFSRFLVTHHDHIKYILTLKQVVEHYNPEIRLFLLEYEDTAELLLSHYEEDRNNQADIYIFPKSLSKEDTHSIISNYLDSDEPNLNYVELARNSKHLKLTPKILLKAKQKAEALHQHHFSEDNSINISVVASLDMEQSEPVVFSRKGSETNVVYGGRYLDSLITEIDKFSVFNSLFLYTDKEGLITLVNKDSEMDNLEKVFMRSKNAYHKGFAFNHKDLLSLTQLGIFSHYLNQKQLSIENTIEGFIQKFFIDNFMITGLVFKVPDGNVSPSDKIRLLAPEMEYLLKQYRTLVSEGYIDHELLQIDSSPVYINEIPSLVSKKYIYSSHQTIRKLQHYFFDPNGILTGRKRKDNKNLFQILTTEGVLKSELEDYQQDYLDKIIQDGFLTINDTGEVKLVHPIITFIAGQLRKNECLSYWHYSFPIRAEIDKLFNGGFLEIIYNLFTQMERFFLNFYLNL
jgi:hypothetical protein